MSECSQVGIKVRELQAQLPKARVVYCSATGASGAACSVGVACCPARASLLSLRTTLSSLACTHTAEHWC